MNLLTLATMNNHHPGVNRLTRWLSTHHPVDGWGVEIWSWSVVLALLIFLICIS